MKNFNENHMFAFLNENTNFSPFQSCFCNNIKLLSPFIIKQTNYMKIYVKLIEKALILIIEN